MKNPVMAALVLLAGAGAASAQEERSMDELRRTFERSMRELQERFEKERRAMEERFEAQRKRFEERGPARPEGRREGPRDPMAELRERIERLERRLEGFAPRMDRILPRMEEFRRRFEFRPQPQGREEHCEKCRPKEPRRPEGRGKSRDPF